MFKHILVATDRTNRVDAPVLAALDLAGQYRAELTVLHVLGPDFADSGQGVSPGCPEKTKTELRKTYGDKSADSGFVQFDVRTGSPWEEILAESRDPDMDLIILGPHSGTSERKRDGRTDKKIGSTVQEVVSRGTCPVMIVNKPVPKEKLMFQKIVVGIDFSVSCECALCLSVRLSRDFNSILYPFFMIPVPPYPKYRKAHYRADMDSLKQRLQEFCDVYLDGTKHEYKIWAGALPHQEVLACARKTDSDLIILGSHTKMRTGKWYAGSVVDRVCAQTDCPVLVVNDPGVLKKWHDIRIPDSNGKDATDRAIHLFHLIDTPPR